ncbi:DNA primase [Pseudoxanthobacter soli DSM 19599]|uniref:DNA primase n=1 Tax=Pseudoxanthobacter soli DSM 19599 TaxID=1123029 RepID=A0A1M7Z8K6_9HYPH|nr:DNA primase [Pseudoxanthobacter soli]SHO61110.1 DNA primase [Pseudoxanthobacter soli DSM 19599]
MRLPDTLLDEIRARLPLSEVVGRRVTWDRRKSQPTKGDFWACCPFHQEKSPSFHVDDRKGFYHCFGCGASGDHIRFVMETEGATFPEAVERLAGDAGVQMPARDAASEWREEVRRTLGDVVALADRFFQQTLRTPAGADARAYIERRGLSVDTVRTFGIGYAPAERDALKRHLAAEGIDEMMMVDAGLVIRPDDGRPGYDRFRNRLMIPIHDLKGRVVAFGGRALAEDQQPKYLNSPETALFSKRMLLFNAHRAREAARAAGSIVVVEGYLDAVAVYQAGIKGVVATLGTAFTEDQIQALWRLAPEPVICFDGDRAGIAAAHRAIDRILPLLESGKSFNFAFLPDGKDPDELIRSGGAERFVAELRASVPLNEVLFEREIAGARVDTPERRAALEKRFDELIGQIRDERVARGYRFAARVKLQEAMHRAGGEAGGRRPETRQGGGGRRGGRGGFAPPEAPSIALVSAPPAEPLELERLVLGLVVEYPALIDRHAEALAAAPLQNELHRRFRDALQAMSLEEADMAGEGAPAAADAPTRVDGQFFSLLGEVHGLEADGRRRGHRLRGRFPILAFHPSEDFVERCFIHFLGRLELKAIESDLDAAIAAAESDLTADDWERIQALQHAVVRRREDIAAEERNFSDEIRSIRNAYGSGSPGLDADTGSP